MQAEGASQVKVEPHDFEGLVKLFRQPVAQSQDSAESTEASDLKEKLITCETPNFELGLTLNYDDDTNNLISTLSRDSSSKPAEGQVQLDFLSKLIQDKIEAFPSPLEDEEVDEADFESKLYRPMTFEEEDLRTSISSFELPSSSEEAPEPAAGQEPNAGAVGVSTGVRKRGETGLEDDFGPAAQRVRRENGGWV